MTKTNVGLAILARKAELGKGKTRLAKGIGKQKAFEAYKHLIDVTAEIVRNSGLPTTVFFDPEVGDTDVWSPNHFDFDLQVTSSNLGDRISAALEGVLAKADTNGALVMGTDCPQLTPDILNDAASALQKNDAVLGPTNDGGFYLLGIRTLDPSLFEGIAWSTEKVAEQMIAAFDRLGYSYQLSPKLADIDEQADWEAYQSWRVEQQLKPVMLKDKTLS